MDIGSLKVELKKHNQHHLLDFWEGLTDEQRHALISQIGEIDIPHLAEQFAKATCTNKASDVDALIKPPEVDLVAGYLTCSKTELEVYWDRGLEEISKGRVAVLLMAGGQGTRLGVGYPKGMYDVHLPSGKTLYQYQGERLRRLIDLAKLHSPNSNTSRITWYIMTSEATQDATTAYFRDNEYFGLCPDDVVFFEQHTIPCVALDGRIIMETSCKIAMSPDGNGGLYRALVTRGILQDMHRRKIEYIHAYCVDNILVHIADPHFIGYCISKQAECGAKVVRKSHPSEAVGVICQVDGRYQVVEYSEISREKSELRKSDSSELVFSAGNICNHFFTRSFLDRFCHDCEKELIHHVAKKKIPYVCPSTGRTVQPTEPNGIKMEKFIFDSFPFARTFAIWEVCRENEFAPLKNSDSAGQDCPRSCRLAILDFHRRLVEESGGKVVPRVVNSCHNDHEGDADNGIPSKLSLELICEISPLLSYSGEGLRELVEGRVFESPLLLYNETLEKKKSVVSVVKGEPWRSSCPVNGYGEKACECSKRPADKVAGDKCPPVAVPSV